MTVIRTNPPSAPRVTSSAAPAPQSASQASTAAQPSGYSSASSFSPSSASSASTGGADSNFADQSSLAKASEILGKTSGGEELKKLLDSGVFQGDDGETAAKLFDKIQGSLSPEDAEVVKGAIGYASVLGGVLEMGKRMIESVRNQTKELLAKLEQQRQQALNGM